MKNNSKPQQAVEPMSEEQAVPEQTTPPAPETRQTDEAPVVVSKRRGTGKALKVTPESEAVISPRPSFWPLLLAFALSIMLLSIVLESFIILGIGVVLLIVSVIGWGLERR
jgi:hypothetical protein